MKARDRKDSGLVTVRYKVTHVVNYIASTSGFGGSVRHDYFVLSDGTQDIHTFQSEVDAVVACERLNISFGRARGGTPEKP